MPEVHLSEASMVIQESDNNNTRRPSAATRAGSIANDFSPTRFGPEAERLLVADENGKFIQLHNA
jgi:hypothetical protein